MSDHQNEDLSHGMTSDASGTDDTSGTAAAQSNQIAGSGSHDCATRHTVVAIDNTPTTASLSSKSATTGPRKTSMNKVPCDECGMMVHLTALYNHKKSKHSEEKPHLCPVATCQYATEGFARRDAFRTHMKRHPGVAMPSPLPSRRKSNKTSRTPTTRNGYTTEAVESSTSNKHTTRLTSDSMTCNTVSGPTSHPSARSRTTSTMDASNNTLTLVEQLEAERRLTRAKSTEIEALYVKVQELNEELGMERRARERLEHALEFTNWEGYTYTDSDEEGDDMEAEA